MFRSEKTAPKMSLASSSALNAWRAEEAVPIGAVAVEGGRDILLEEEDGLGSQRRLYMQSAVNTDQQ